ncbi:MAG: hypothetical protein AAGE43_13960 [Pseudomonadota bacterium]
MVRFYESEGEARAVEALLQQEKIQGSIIVLTPPAAPGYGENTGTEDASATIDRMSTAMAAGGALRHPKQDLTGPTVEGLKRGYTVVVVRPGYGEGSRAQSLLDSTASVGEDLLPAKPDPTTSDTLRRIRELSGRPDPFSDYLGIPSVIDGRSRTRLAPSNAYYAGSNPLMKSGNPSPLSSLFGLKPLMTWKTGKSSSLGLPLLSSKAAPLSSMFGLPVLTKEGAPLSRLFRLPTLTRG